MNFLTRTIIVLFFFLPLQVFGQEAASTGALIGSGTTIEQEKEAMRRQRAEGFWALMINRRKAAQAHTEQQAERREQRRQKRIECNTDVRKANRDTLLPILLGCYRATLSLELEMLRKEKLSAEAMPGPTEPVRRQALSSIGGLMDAIATVIEAIDAGVYTSKADLEQTHANLAKTYRPPVRLNLLKLRVDRSLTWIAHLLTRIADIPETSIVSQEAQDGLIEARTCLEHVEESLTTLLTANDEKILLEEFRQLQTSAASCGELFREAHSKNVPPEPPDEESGNEN